MTSKDILETQIPERLRANPALAKEINSVILFDVSGEGGGKWTLDTTKSEGWVSEGDAGASKMTVSVSNEDFVKIVSKQLNAQMAAMQGKLKFKPMDMGLAMKLAKLLG
ncbi:SCP2 sterol-binding domain-containing protein [Archangium primigenium]|uniref:SCP2 sterol-binding domain-containing protein n=1 Tax=[Archangium] primigenium TaxID=2792470 RepID=UPI00195ECE5C|nr:SCP2 sterol-binding domain-containing protein [Archangium primigenium]MBM7115268.1 SCP2 sterol-binding domain-containing protein [Archangium primigenium]